MTKCCGPGKKIRDKRWEKKMDKRRRRTNEVATYSRSKSPSNKSALSLSSLTWRSAVSKRVRSDSSLARNWKLWLAIAIELVDSLIPLFLHILYTLALLFQRRMRRKYMCGM